MLREAKLLGLDSSAFLASVFDAPKTTIEHRLVLPASVEQPGFSSDVIEEDHLCFLQVS